MRGVKNGKRGGCCNESQVQQQQKKGTESDETGKILIVLMGERERETMPGEGIK